MKGETPIWAHGRRLSAKLYDRAKLLAHNLLDGPAIVTEMDSTTLILPGHFGEVDRFRKHPDSPEAVEFPERKSVALINAQHEKEAGELKMPKTQIIERNREPFRPLEVDT